ncbi:hypothetical protein CYMTET_6946, partial [Cymbomonas tetramitiformis]
ASNLRNFTAECTDTATCEVTYAPLDQTPTVEGVFPPGGNVGDSVTIYGQRLLNVSLVQLVEAVDVGATGSYWAGACVRCDLKHVGNCTLTGSQHLSQSELAGTHFGHLSQDFPSGLDRARCILGNQSAPRTNNLFLHVLAQTEVAEHGWIGSAGINWPFVFGAPVIHSVEPRQLSGAGGRITIHGSGFRTSTPPTVYLGGVRPAFRGAPVEPDPSLFTASQQFPYTLQWQTGCNNSCTSDGTLASCGSEGTFFVDVGGEAGENVSFTVAGTAVSQGCMLGTEVVESTLDLGVPSNVTVRPNRTSTSTDADAWGVDWLRVYAGHIGDCVEDYPQYGGGPSVRFVGCTADTGTHWCDIVFAPYQPGLRRRLHTTSSAPTTSLPTAPPVSLSPITTALTTLLPTSASLSPITAAPTTLPPTAPPVSLSPITTAPTTLLPTSASLSPITAAPTTLPPKAPPVSLSPITTAPTITGVPTSAPSVGPYLCHGQPIYASPIGNCVSPYYERVGSSAKDVEDVVSSQEDSLAACAAKCTEDKYSSFEYQAGTSTCWMHKNPEPEVRGQEPSTCPCTLPGQMGDKGSKDFHWRGGDRTSSSLTQPKIVRSPVNSRRGHRRVCLNTVCGLSGRASKRSACIRILQSSGTSMCKLVTPEHRTAFGSPVSMLATHATPCSSW